MHESQLDPVQLRQLKRVRRLAWLMDRSIRIPGINYRIGFEGLLGMIPAVGDLAGGILSAYLIYLARQAGAPRAVMAKMAGVAAVDAVVGSVPVLGDVFDFAYKGNIRIARLLEDHLAVPHAKDMKTGA